MYFDLNADALFDAIPVDAGDPAYLDAASDTYFEDHTTADPFGGFDVAADVPGFDTLDQPGAGDPAYPTVGFDPAFGGPFDIDG